MKKTLITALAAFALTAHAQGFDSFDYDKGISIIGQFGMNISNYRMNQTPLPSMNPKAGFNVGIHAEYLLPECRGVYLNAGLEYNMKGAKNRVESSLINYTAIARPYYVQIPIHVGFRYNVLEDVGVYADFGPYFALGTNGKYILKFDDFSEDQSVALFNNDSNENFYDMQRTDFGLGFRIGAEYADHYNFIFSCDWGLTDMLTQEQKHALVALPGIDKPYIKNFAAGLTFGYRF